MPEWSRDGSKLVFWHIDTHSTSNREHWDYIIYTYIFDGGMKEKVELPNGYEYRMPSFDHSSEDRLIFSRKKKGVPCYQQY